MLGDGEKMCFECQSSSTKFSNGCYCQGCGKWLCAKCLRAYEAPTDATESNEMDINFDNWHKLECCKFCDIVNVKHDGRKKNSEKVHPLESPHASPEPPSPSVGGDLIQCDHLAPYLESRDCAYSPHATNQSVTMFSPQPSPGSVHCSTSRSDEEEEVEDLRKQFYIPRCDFYHDTSDLDSNSVCTTLDFYGCESVGASPLDSPSGFVSTSHKIGQSIHQGQAGSPLSQNSRPFDPKTVAVLGRPGKGTQESENTDDFTDHLSSLKNHHEKSQQPLEFENNGLIWFPPPPEDENDEAESNFFTYDDDDDDIGDSGAMFSSSSSLSGMFPSKDKPNEGNKEPLRAVIQGHFRALVSQLLQGENIKLNKENSSEEWLDIVTNIAWQAANFVKPDTSQGGSMDPSEYVKVKCVASGKPSDSTLVKGVVCTKNIKHKRMTSQHKNPRLLLLGGSLEYQSVVNPLASFETLMQQEKDHLKMIIMKIEALRPNVLLVEKSVSPYAQEYLLAKDISLVPNVKKSLLECIARCTGAFISPSIDNITTTRVGQCELFRVERISEEHENANQFNKKPSKTLMFFEGCPRRLGCTVLLKGTCREELKKIKHVVQYAVFAAYQLSLETSFLADEGASLPKMTPNQLIFSSEKLPSDNVTSVVLSTNSHAVVDAFPEDNGSADLKPEHSVSGLLSLLLDGSGISALSAGSLDYMLENALFDGCHNDLASRILLAKSHNEDVNASTLLNSGTGSSIEADKIQDTIERGDPTELGTAERTNENEVSGGYFSGAETYQSILVSFSSRCVLKGAVCERSRLLRIKFYGSFDKPLGRYLHDDLFDQTSYCKSCNEPAEAHVLCYTHQQGNLTINVRSLSSVQLPGERDGKIWMWHRCLRCAHVDGVPPATRRVVMSDAAWGLSFGKFLELSFSNHATANRVAPCGHSLQRDCLRFYGFGSMVAFFRYSPINILNVHLPPSMLEFNGQIQQEWITKEAAELWSKMEAFHRDISDVLDKMEKKSKSCRSEFSDSSDLHNHIMELKDHLSRERNDYNLMLKPVIVENSVAGQTAVDILELNRLRRALVFDSHVWDRKLYSLDSLLRTASVIKTEEVDSSPHIRLKELTEVDSLGSGLKLAQGEASPSLHLVQNDSILLSHYSNREDGLRLEEEPALNRTQFDDIVGDPNLSDRIDSVWTGTCQVATDVEPLHVFQLDGHQSGYVKQGNLSDDTPLRRLMAPLRVHSFDSALRFQERLRKGLLPSSLHLSKLGSFNASGDFRNMARDPVSNTLRTYSQMLPLEAQKLNLTSSSPAFISTASLLAGGARLLLPLRSQRDIVVGVFDDDPASIVSYVLSSKEYKDWIENGGSWAINEQCKEDSGVSECSAWQSFGSLDLEFICHGSYGSDAPSSISTLTDPKRSPHLTISYGDDSQIAGGEVKFSVTCYFAKQFHSLRRRCCPSDVDFVRSLSRCQRWSAQGGKSNVYFAKSLDDRFIIKQVVKTELESFEEFAPEYFKHLTDSLKSGSPTCLAKVLGLYQVTVKHLKGGKEMKMDFVVMENLFYRRSITRVYDLKGSARSRYNPDTSGRNKVLLDMNLVEALRTDPIFLGSKAKRSLERAIWNDTSFLASIDVMDYSLLVGIDEERRELVLGIIDFMRQYTWDKHLETWVKASGILGGPKNASPTVISPKQYKKRFRKAMTSYFLTVPDQWSA